MLILVLASLLAGSTVEVHEWGVLLWDGQTITSAGARDLVLEDPMLLEDKAPVICLHGAEFSGTVTVASLGMIDGVYPFPDIAGGPQYGLRGLGSMVRWEIRATRAEPEGYPACGSLSEPMDSGYQWAVPLWREGDALFLSREDGFADRFLYYEATIGEGSFPPPLQGFAVASAEDDSPEADRVLLLTRDDSGEVHFVVVPQGDLSMAAQASPHIYSCDEVVAILEDWAGGILTPEEVAALWLTWEDYVVSDGWYTGSKAVFVVPGEMVERTSIILVDPGENLPVEIRRFFLGIVEV